MIQYFIIEKTKTIIQGCKIAVSQDFKTYNMIVSKYGLIMNSIIDVFSMLNSELDQIIEIKILDLISF